MNVKGVNTHNIINLYNNNKVNNITKSEEVKQRDRIEISQLGKSLINYSLDGVNVDNSKKIAELKEKMESGTYNVDAKLTAQSIIDKMKGRNI